MAWKRFNCNTVLNTEEVPVIGIDELRSELIERVINGEERVLAFFGVKRSNAVILYVILGNDSISRLFMTSVIFVEGIKSYTSLTPEIPSLHLFEREFFEETGILPEGHPWLKPVRYSSEHSSRCGKMVEYPFYAMDGDEIHEVAVGPVHAGVIEPGHFRFQCFGENIYHLEIQLGYQHRGVERIIMDKNNGSKGKRIFFPQLAEKIAGDSAVAHASVYSSLMETLTGTEITTRSMGIRAVSLELERAAVHIGDLAAIFNDIGFLMGNAVFSALRTLIINTTLSICGSRFGMGLLRVGGVNFDIDPELSILIKNNIDYVQKRVEKLVPLTMLEQPSVLARLDGTGIVNTETARLIGMVGPAARASGLQCDTRTDYPHGMFRRYPARKVILGGGDVFARTYIRYIEMKNSFNYIREQLEVLQKGETYLPVTNELPGNSIALSMTEGWRGEVIHVAVTDSEGDLIRYKIKDPSFNNWFGLALAVRNNGISEFPLCNKSFNLSYCGHDL